jgi:hypothetical protein
MAVYMYRKIEFIDRTKAFYLPQITASLMVRMRVDQDWIKKFLNQKYRKSLFYMVFFLMP